MEKKDQTLVGSGVNTRHIPTWLDIPGKGVGWGGAPWTKAWIHFLGSGWQINRLGEDYKLSLYKAAMHTRGKKQKKERV